MQRNNRPEELDLRRPNRSMRSPSVASDVPSVSVKSIRSPPSSVTPEPLYVAASAASHLVSVQIEVHDATISSPALGLINGFLDHLLWNVLQSARSTQLSALRPAVIRILQSRLGEKAIEAADEELQEYLGDGKDEELTEFRGGQEPRGDFDTELAWKLARLRCMVYTRLGDLEEEDEDTFIEEQGLDEGGDGPRRFSNHASSCTPAAAIFLTSILETLGESALYFAGQATQRRTAATLSHTGADSPAEVTALPSLPIRTIVEDVDVQQLRDSPLKRLWRGWRTTLRTPRYSGARPQFSAPFISNSRVGSFSSTRDSSGPESLSRPVSSEAARPSQIPLPMSEDDIREIEIPGLAAAKERATMESESALPNERSRPRSMVIIPAAVTPPSPQHSDGRAPTPARTPKRRPRMSHTRSYSLPTPNVSPFPSPPAADLSFATPMESSDPTDVVSPEATTPIPHRVSPFSLLDQERINAAMAGTIPSLGVGYVDAVTASHVLEAEDNHEATPEDIVNDYAEAQRRSTALAEERARATAPALGQNERRTPAHINTTGRLSPGRPSPIYAELQSRDQPFDESMLLVNRQGYQPVQTAPDHRPGQLVTEPSAAQYSPDEYWTPETPEEAGQNSDARRLRKDQNNFKSTDRDLETAKTKLIRSKAHNASNSTSGQTPQNINGLTQDAYRAHKSRQSESALPNASYHAKQASTSSNRTQIPPPGSERAAVQRIEAPLHTRDTSANRSNRSTSTSSSKDKRPGTSNTQVSRRRAATATRPSLDDGPRGSSGSIHTTDDKKQSLEMLIQSEETLHYTLTPQNMRQMESPESARRAPRSEAAEMADFFKNTAPPGSGLPKSRPPAPAKGINGLRSHPPDANVPLPSPLHDSYNPGATVRERGFSSASTKSKVAGAGPRSAKVSDARAVQDMRDFADFAKSTGPSGPDELPKSIDPRIATSRMSNDIQTGPRSPGQRKSSSQPVQRQNSNTSNQTRKTIFRLQARAPTVTTGEQSDLIDFIREGPPQGKGNHRIPRTVAPFRTTMDSDDMQALGSPRDREIQVPRSSLTSTQDSSIIDKSMHSSFNSRTGLLESTDRAASKYNGTNSSKALPSVADSEDFKPQRKQRRVKDPYAIDTDSEDEIESDAPGEESLVDFLRNNAPPRGSSPAPLTGQLNKAPKSTQQPGQQTTGSPTMRDRLLRKTSLSGFGQRSTSYGSSKSEERRSPPPSYNSVGGRPTSPHLTQNGSRFDSYRPTEPAYAAHVDRNRAPKSNARVPGPIRQGGPRTGTTDLADFLRNTAPPPTTTQTYVPSPSKEENGFVKFFSRRRRVAT